MDGSYLRDVYQHFRSDIISLIAIDSDAWTIQRRNIALNEVYPLRRFLSLIAFLNLSSRLDCRYRVVLFILEFVHLHLLYTLGKI
jgi:hypothetical protein